MHHSIAKTNLKIKSSKTAKKLKIFGKTLLITTLETTGFQLQVLKGVEKSK